MDLILAHVRRLAHGERARQHGPWSRPFRARLRSCMLTSMSAGRISRRGFLAVGLIGLLGTPAAAAAKPAVTVYKEPT